MYLKSKSKVALKINVSEHKSRISLKLLGFSKNTLTKRFLKFYLLYNRFCLRYLQSTLQKLRIAIFGQF